VAFYWAIQFGAISVTRMAGLAGARRRKDSQRRPAARPFNQPLIYAGLGDKDRAFEALDCMAPLGPFRIGRALSFPEFALIRRDPWVKVLRKTVGLPE
jgi:hypothetical protein